MKTRSTLGVALITAATIATTAAPGHTSPTTQVWTCGRAADQPPRMSLWCYHASVWTQGMRWSRWTDTKAVATGEYVVNSCDISCAEGPFLKYPARFTFSKPRKVKAFRGYETRLPYDATLFTRIKVTFNSTQPANWSGQPYVLVKERSPGTGRCELVWEHRGEKYTRC